MRKIDGRVFLWITIILLSGCAAPMAYYNQAERGGVVILPDNYEVQSTKYPKYRIKRSRSSPSPNPIERQVPMYSTDVWIVTHEIGPYYLIYSYDYDQRSCKKGLEAMRKKIKKGEPCKSNESSVHILIDHRGDVIGDGWVGIYDPKQVWAPDRMVDLPLGKPADPMWGPQPSFEKINNN